VNGRKGEWETGRNRDVENRRIGEWGNGRMGEWEKELIKNVP
jgi:hypothetical protein